MTKAQNGDKVRVHYTGTLDSGEVFDSSYEREPLEFIIGEGKLIPGFEKAVEGMEVGEKKKIKIPYQEAYGEKRDELLLEVPKTDLPEGLDPQVGMQFQLNTPTGGTIIAELTEVKDDTVILDANHPLSGKDLNFEIELVEIVSPIIT